MVDTTLPGILLPADIHANRPAANAVGGGTVFPCTTHGKTYQSDGVSTWSDWFDPAAVGVGAHAHSGADITSGTVVDARIDAAISRDSELATHEADTTSIHGIANSATLYAAGGTDVAVADGGTGASTAAAAATNLGLGTGDSPQHAAVNIGHASDTTLSRASAGDLAVEGNALYRAGGTDVPVADGGTGASSASAARTNLGVVPGTDVASLTAGRVPIAQLASGTPDGTKFIRDDGTLQTPSGGGAALTVEEVDGSPTDSAVTKIKFPNGTLAISSHEATYTPAAGGGSLEVIDGTGTPDTSSVDKITFGPDIVYSDGSGDMRVWPWTEPAAIYSSNSKSDDFLSHTIDAKWSTITSNAGNETAYSITNGYCIIEPNASGTSTGTKRVFGKKQTAPSGSFSVWAYYEAGGGGTTASEFDLREGIFVGFVGGNAYVCGPAPQDSAAAAENTISSFSITADWGTTGGSGATLAGQFPTMRGWYKITYDAAADTLTFYYSPSGVFWNQFFSVGSITVDPDYIGFCIFQNSSAIPNNTQSAVRNFRVA